ncbi:MAG: hypothetical protein HYV63_27315 [Candidatus Schekmanbacteria bacterium]|nr:hypothetical protein [Candidatus Schekmanbacteria bacterium]
MSHRERIAASLLCCCAILVAAPAAGARGSGAAWSFLSAPSELRALAEKDAWVRPQGAHRVLAIDAGRLTGALAGARPELSPGFDTAVIIEVPTPAGELEAFRVWESPIMAPELSAWLASSGWPMKTYAGVSVHSPARSIRFDWGGPAGFHAAVSAGQDSYYVDPYNRGDTLHYASYKRSALRETHPRPACLTPTRGEPTSPPSYRVPLGRLRTYRLAMAATGEYTAFHGGTASAGLAGLVTTINRVNQIYERDLSIRLVLIANNESIVYTDSSTDPYTNGESDAMVEQNQANLDARIGASSYDIGHVVGTGSGGYAPGLVCRNGEKAMGMTGRDEPRGDGFDIDYVAHEMGHQFSADHTFDGMGGSCLRGRWDPAAVEPGSGATIMGYAGICGEDDLQAHSDAMFHSLSIDQILAYSESLSCSRDVSNGNQAAPVIDAGASYFIPARTPFALTAASASDADGDAVTISWEEYDFNRGPLGTPLNAGDRGDNPIIRTWPPTSSRERLIPRLEDVLAGVPAAGETLPTTGRTLTFRAVVRDNHSAGGLTSVSTMAVTSVVSATGFAVTEPAAAAKTSGSVTVKWDVADTTLSPISTSAVDILLSTDGGATFTTTLAAGTPNDGNQKVNLTATPTTTARIMVRAQGNIFLAVSPGDFTIEEESEGGGGGGCFRNAADGSGRLPDELAIFAVFLAAATLRRLRRRGAR